MWFGLYAFFRSSIVDHEPVIHIGSSNAPRLYDRVRVRVRIRFRVRVRVTVRVRVRTLLGPSLLSRMVQLQRVEDA